ncbi:Lar family restriction alleviation protein [Pseudomonas sp. FYR_5]|uniref:Lar family restriction alleviation protein n=1 Tax=Pseudomonas sp. FYR_5 TaxID=3367173 RepID=UPI00370B9262
MPTENRSSYTEMVSEPLPCPFCGQQDFLIERLDSDASVVICQGLTGPHEACLARGPVGVAQNEGEEQPGRDKAVELWNARAEQHQGEPVAWMDPRSPHMHATISNEVKQHNLKFGGAPASAVNGYTIPLYTHADPGEAERLREGITKHWKVVCDQRAELDTLREQLRLMTGDYRTAIVNGHERITFLGGDCDSVEKMLADNPNYANAQTMLKRQS